MKFIGAFLWALGDPDKKRLWNVFHPLSGAGSCHSRARCLSGILVPTIVFFGLIGVLHYSQISYLKYFALFLNLIFLSSGFLKLSVSSVIENPKISSRIRVEGIYFMLLAGTIPMIL
jgi:hypothetical protein